MNTKFTSIEEATVALVTLRDHYTAKGWIVTRDESHKTCGAVTVTNSQHTIAACARGGPCRVMLTIRGVHVSDAYCVEGSMSATLDHIDNRLAR